MYMRNPLIKLIAVVVVVKILCSLLPTLIGVAISIFLLAVIGRSIMGLYFIYVNRPNYMSWLDYLSINNPDGFKGGLKFSMFSTSHKLLCILSFPSYGLAFVVILLVWILMKFFIFINANQKIKEIFSKRIKLKKVDLFKSNTEGYCPKCLALQTPSLVRCPSCDNEIPLKKSENKTIFCPSCNNKYDSGSFYKKGSVRAVCPSCNTYPLMDSKFNTKNADSTVLFVSNKCNYDIYRKILEGLRSCDLYDADAINSYYNDLYDSKLNLNGMLLKVSRADIKQKVLFKSILLECNSNLAQKISNINGLNDIVFLVTSNNIESIKNEIEAFIREYSKFAEFGRNAENVNIYILLSAAGVNFKNKDMAENNTEDVILYEIFGSNLDLLKMKAKSIRVVNINKENAMTEGDSYKYLYNSIIKN